MEHSTTSTSAGASSYTSFPDPSRLHYQHHRSRNSTGSTFAPALLYGSTGLQQQYDWVETMSAAHSHSLADDNSSLTSVRDGQTRLLVRHRLRLKMALFFGYMGLYVARTAFTVLVPVFRDFLELADIGSVLSVGYLMYTLGLMLAGYAVDKLVWPHSAPCMTDQPHQTLSMVVTSATGRNIFILGVLGSVAGVAAACGARLFPVVLTGWCISRFFQGAAWPALVQCVGLSWPSAEAGRVIGFIAMGYGMGDALARLFLGGLLSIDRNITTVGIAACVVSGVFCAVPLALRRSFQIAQYLNAKLTSEELGGDAQVAQQPAPPDATETRPANHQQKQTRASNAPPTAMSRSATETTLNVQRSDSLPEFAPPAITSFGQLIMRAPRIILICLANCCLACVREVFLSWANLYLRDTLHVRDDMAAILSLVYPLVGIFSVVTVGAILDSANKRQPVDADPTEQTPLLLPSPRLPVAPLPPSAPSHASSSIECRAQPPRRLYTQSTYSSLDHVMHSPTSTLAEPSSFAAPAYPTLYRSPSVASAVSSSRSPSRSSARPAAVAPPLGYASDVQGQHTRPPSVPFATSVVCFFCAGMVGIHVAMSLCSEKLARLSADSGASPQWVHAAWSTFTCILDGASAFFTLAPFSLADTLMVLRHCEEVPGATVYVGQTVALVDVSAYLFSTSAGSVVSYLLGQYGWNAVMWAARLPQQ
ncbi:hypothetical protein RI367_001645 [Sorochytrium milnesiophthora]